jgi:hypothetical protein
MPKYRVMVNYHGTTSNGADCMRQRSKIFTAQDFDDLARIVYEWRTKTERVMYSGQWQDIGMVFPESAEEMMT